MAKNIVTVKQMIESLQRFDENAPVEIAIRQYNKVYPVAYCSPNGASVDGFVANMNNGQDVRIEISLPWDEETFMFVSKRKK